MGLVKPGGSASACAPGTRRPRQRPRVLAGRRVALASRALGPQALRGAGEG